VRSQEPSGRVPVRARAETDVEDGEIRAELLDDTLDVVGVLAGAHFIALFPEGHLERGPNWAVVFDDKYPYTSFRHFPPAPQPFSAMLSTLE
jgi:hypothetical protein